MDAQVQITRSF